MLSKEDILKLDSKKHVKIWFLYKLGMSRREIAEALGTNPGHVGNEIKAYEKNEDKRKAAESLNITETTIKKENNENKNEITIEEATSYISGGFESTKKEQQVKSSEEIKSILAYNFAKKKNWSVVKMGKGGVLIGKKHGSGGIKAHSPTGNLEVEGGEIIINAAAAKEHCEELSKINQSAGDGVAFPCDHPALDGVQGPMGGKGAKLTYGGKIGAKNTNGVKFFKDKDGRGRFEIDDSTSFVDLDALLDLVTKNFESKKYIQVKVKNIIKEWDGYKNYPDIKEIIILFTTHESKDSYMYAYNINSDIIYVNSNKIYHEINIQNDRRRKVAGFRGSREHDARGNNSLSLRISSEYKKELISRLFHEIQHPIQAREKIKIIPSDVPSVLYGLKKFYRMEWMADDDFKEAIGIQEGRSFDSIFNDYYESFPSEFEALDVERRAFYNKEQRERIRPEIEMNRASNGTKIAEGIEVEKEHTDLYNEISRRLEAEGHKIPMSQHEFFRMIASAHIKERGDYYQLLKAYVEHAPTLMDKPYYLLSKEEVISCRDFIEMRSAAGIELTPKCKQRIKDLARYSMVKFNTLLKDLK